ncbi:MAG: hypothetical protein J5509_06495 [Lachnospiraceae bacterium]|nr:hypothetical protein [Lachnospiraceae bacterium]
MSSKIEQKIEELEDYIDSCKYQPLSKINIIVNKEEIDEHLRELRNRTPEEIRQYQKIIAQREEILQKARERADKLLKDTADQTQQLISEQEIMKQAYAQANEVVTIASEQAQQIIDKATMEANNLKAAAMQYLDDMLEHLDNLMTSAMNTTTAHYDSYMKAMAAHHDVVISDRMELHPDADIMQDVSNVVAPIPAEPETPAPAEE